MKNIFLTISLLLVSVFAFAQDPMSPVYDLGGGGTADGYSQIDGDTLRTFNAANVQTAKKYIAPEEVLRSATPLQGMSATVGSITYQIGYDYVLNVDYFRNSAGNFEAFSNTAISDIIVTQNDVDLSAAPYDTYPSDTELTIIAKENPISITNTANMREVVDGISVVVGITITLQAGEKLVGFEGSGGTWEFIRSSVGTTAKGNTLNINTSFDLGTNIFVADFVDRENLHVFTTDGGLLNNTTGLLLDINGNTIVQPYAVQGGEVVYPLGSDWYVIKTAKGQLITNDSAFSIGTPVYFDEYVGMWRKADNKAISTIHDAVIIDSINATTFRIAFDGVIEKTGIAGETLYLGRDGEYTKNVVGDISAPALFFITDNLAEIRTTRALVYADIPSTVRDIPASNQSFYYFGDSVTVGLNSTSGNSWTDLVSANYTAFEINVSISGSTLHSFDNISGQTADANLALIPNYVQGRKLFFAYGLNDMKNATITADTFYNDYVKTIDYAISQRGWSPNDIVIVGIYQVKDCYYTTFPTGSPNLNDASRHARFNHAIKAIVTKYGVRYADTYTDMWEADVPANLVDDCLHPNDAGHAVVTASVINALEYAADINTRAAYVPKAGSVEFEKYETGGSTCTITKTIEAGIEVSRDTLCVLDSLICSDVPDYYLDMTMFSADQTIHVSINGVDATFNELTNAVDNMDGSVTMTNPGTTSTTVGASAVQVLSGDFYVDFSFDKAPAVNDHKAFVGLTTDPTGTGQGNMIYRVYQVTTGNIRIDGPTGNSLSIDPINYLTDTVRIQRIGTEIFYFRNGAQIFVDPTESGTITKTSKEEFLNQLYCESDTNPFANLVEYADRAAAITGGLAVGDWYKITLNVQGDDHFIAVQIK